MEFRFEPKLTALDIWKLSMHQIYKSLVGWCNMILSVAIIALTFRFWNEIGEVLKGILVFSALLFPVIQPVMVYFRARSQVKTIPQDMVLTINDTGLHISADHQEQHISWDRVRGAIQEKGLLILAVAGGRGYFLTDRVLGTQKETLIGFLDSKIKNKS